MVYKYVAKNWAGRTVTGTMEASDAALVREHLSRLGFIPLSIKEVKTKRKVPTLSLGGKVKDVELINFTRQFVTLHRAGLPIPTIIRTLAEQTENKYFKTVLESIAKDINEGLPLSQAMAKHPKIFSEYYVSCVEAGEAGGVLDSVFEQLLELLDRQRRTRGEIKAAARYPIIVMVGLVIAFVVLVGFVIPKFVQMFTALGAELPLPTRILIAVNNLFQNYWFAIIVVISGMGLLWWIWINTKVGRLWWDKFKLRIPLIGHVIYKDLIARFARMFAVLDRSGLPILRTLEIVANTANNKYFERKLMEIKKAVYDGKGLSEPMRDSELFAPLVIQMVQTGEESGTLDDMLNKVGEHYEREVSYTIRNLTGIIEPVLTVVLGCVIIFFFLAIFLPYLNMLQAITAGGIR